MLPDRVSNPGPLTYESGALPIALRGPAAQFWCNLGLMNALPPSPFCHKWGPFVTKMRVVSAFTK